MADEDTDDARGYLSIYLKGAAMGAADTVPGVSGGTVALITGIYGRLVAAIAALDPRIIRHLGPGGGGRDRFLAELRAADLPFLLTLGAGVATAVVLLARVMHGLLIARPAAMNALFFGLIGASSVVIARDVPLRSRRAPAAALLGIVTGFAVTGVSGGGGIGHSLPVVLLAGATASAAMLLPGISGAAILYILGQYEFLTGTLTRTVDAVAAGTLPARDGAVVAVFLAGVAAGLLTISRAVSWALDRSPAVTFAALIGLMVGALRMPVEAVAAAGGFSPTVAAAAVLGAAVVLGLDALSDRSPLSV